MLRLRKYNSLKSNKLNHMFDFVNDLGTILTNEWRVS